MDIIQKHQDVFYMCCQFISRVCLQRHTRTRLFVEVQIHHHSYLTCMPFSQKSCIHFKEVSLRELEMLKTH